MTIRFYIHYDTYPGQDLLFCGALENASWLRDENALEMSYQPGGYWCLELPVEQNGLLQYRYLVRENGSISRREWGRHQINIQPDKDRVMEVQDTWQAEPGKMAGTAIPVFSLRSKTDWGIGDFADLLLMTDWLEKTGQKILQLLPLNDTTNSFSWYDSYPYSCISVFALHPIYLAPSLLPRLEDKEKATEFESRGNILNKNETIQYEEVLSLKWEYFHLIFDQEKTPTMNSVEYLQFVDENRFWLEPYAAYCYLMRKHKCPCSKDWGEFAIYNAERVSWLCDPTQAWHEAIAIHYYIQFQLQLQLEQAHRYAAEKGIVLKGDIPIGVNPKSVETWQQTDLFRMDVQTGAPPDEFSINGQNWGFPVYNWERMHQQHYKWWSERLKHLARYFDAYRIDHILGFFRIWGIPSEAVSGLLGYFSPALPYSPEEIRAFGLDFDPETMCRPYIDDTLLKEYHRQELLGFLKSDGEKQYRLKTEVDSQSKILTYFGASNQESLALLRADLCRMCNEVLFIEDTDSPGHYHPRILGNQTHVYHSLDQTQQQAFDRLYDFFYFERHNALWQEQAMTILPELLSSTNMTACGEDLGMIPACVPLVMSKLCMLSLELERMPKTFGLEFEPLDRIPYLSVCTTSTHDMSPLRAWWEENPLNAQRYWRQVLNENEEAPRECSAAIAYRIVQEHLDSQAMWVILPWQDWLSMHADLRKKQAGTERINVPENSEHHWNYRIHLDLEDLLNAESLNNTIAKMLAQSGR